MKVNEIKDMIKFLFESKTTIHVDTLDNTFHNGLILECHETFIVIHDRIWGETPIPISEIKTIAKFRDKKVRE